MNIITYYIKSNPETLRFVVSVNSLESDFFRIKVCEPTANLNIFTLAYETSIYYKITVNFSM